MPRLGYTDFFVQFPPWIVRMERHSEDGHLGSPWRTPDWRLSHVDAARLPLPNTHRQPVGVG